MKREDILKLEVIPSFFRLYCVASGILVPQPGMEPRSMAVKALVLSTGLPGNSLKVYHLDPKRKAKKGNAKECLNYCTIALISHASKIMLRILQARLQYENHVVPDVQAGFRKGRGTRDQIGNSRWIIEKAREFQKNIYFCFID